MKSTLSTGLRDRNLTVRANANNTWAKFDQNPPQTRAKLNKSKPNVSGLNCLFRATSVDFE
jgi:hypothetical protein